MLHPEYPLKSRLGRHKTSAWNWTNSFMQQDRNLICSFMACRCQSTSCGCSKYAFFWYCSSGSVIRRKTPASAKSQRPWRVLSAVATATGMQTAGRPRGIGVRVTALTACGRQALLAGRYCHRHGALFLLVREKKYSREARLGDELREHRGDYASRRVLTCNKQVRSL